MIKPTILKILPQDTYIPETLDKNEERIYSAENEGVAVVGDLTAQIYGITDDDKVWTTLYSLQNGSLRCDGITFYTNFHDDDHPFCNSAKLYD